MLERDTVNEIGSVRHPQREIVSIRVIYVLPGITDRRAQLDSLRRQGIRICNVHEHRVDEPCNAHCAQDVAVDA